MNNQYNNSIYIYENEFSNNNENLCKSSCIDILSVEYGGNNTYTNVTNKAKELFLKDNKLSISKKVNLKNIFGDPCSGIEKELKINVILNNNNISICEKEYNSYLKNDIIIGENKTLDILSVEYGIINKYFNVTNKVKELYLKENDLFISTKINLKNIFGDPCSGVQKEIKITALVNNKKICICEKETNCYLINDIIICEKNNIAVLNVENEVSNYYNLCYNKPYKNEKITDISNLTLNTYKDYCEHSFINEDEIFKNLPRGFHNQTKKININMLEKFIILVDFSNLGGGTSVFIETIISRYKKYQTFLIARNFKDHVFFTVNDEYQIDRCFTNDEAYKLLIDNKHKIEKIFMNHIINHSRDFLNNLFNLNIKITAITHDFLCIFNDYQIPYNDMNLFLDNETKSSFININKYDQIITQNKANMYVYNSFIEDKNKIVVTPLPDFKNPKDLITTANDIIVVGIIGVISNVKGFKELVNIINFYKNISNIKFVVFGTTDYPIESFTNSYVYTSIQELNNLLTTHKPNVLMELSIWPETYSYTLTLGMITQLPILCLKKNNYCPVEDRLSKYDKTYYFSNIVELNKLIFDKKQDFFYTIEPKIYYNDFWDNYFITRKEKYTENRLNDISSNSVNNNVNMYCIYFPQYHEFKENNISFYNGYTDTKNVSLLCKSNLNIDTTTPSLKEFNLNSIDDYDYIKNKQILQKQIDIIYDYKICGFAIFYYWFSLNTITRKNEIMENVINQFFDDSIDMKNRKVFFMWANESWTSNPAFGNTSEKIENNYSDIKAIEENTDNLIKFFKNENYLKIDNKPVFEVHHPWFIKEIELCLFYYMLNDKCIKNNFSGIHFIVNAINGKYNNSNFINKMHHLNYKKNTSSRYDKNNQIVLDYKTYIDYLDNDKDYCDINIQTLVFDFDNRARLFKPDRLANSTLCINNSEFDKTMFIKKILEIYKKNKNKKSDVEKILLINSWNEWGEKMVIEPSKEYGYYYLNLLREHVLK